MDASKNSRVAFLLFLGTMSAMGPLAIDMYLPALKTISIDLSASMAEVQFSLTFFFVGIASGQFIYGPIVDRFGKRRPLLFGINLYIIGSILCAHAINNEMLVVARFLQALGGASGVVISRVIVRDQFQKNEAAKIFSMLMLIIGVAPILAPSVGAFLDTHLGWKTIFYLLATVGIFVFFRSFILVKDTHKQIKAFEKKSLLNEFRLEFRYMIEVITDKTFIIPSLSGALMQAALFSYLAGSAYLIMEKFGFSSNIYSFIFAANAVALIGCAQINARIVGKFPLEKIFSLSQKIHLLLAILLLIVGLYSSSNLLFIIVLLLSFASLGFSFPNSTAMALAYNQHTGRASAILGTIQFSIAAMATSIVNSIQANQSLAMVYVMIGVSTLSNIIFSFYKLPENR